MTKQEAGGVPRMRRSASRQRRGALLIRGPCRCGFADSWVPALRSSVARRIASGTRVAAFAGRSAARRDASGTRQEARGVAGRSADRAQRGFQPNVAQHDGPLSSRSGSRKGRMRNGNQSRDARPSLDDLPGPRMIAGRPVRGSIAMDASKRIDQLIAAIADWRGKTFAHVRKTILAADPEIIEEWKWMGSPVWSRHGIIAVANAHKGKVKLTFDKGARLPDPEKLFNAGLEGNQRRAIDFFEVDKVNERALKALVRAAIEYNLSRVKKPSAKSKARAAKKA